MNYFHIFLIFGISSCLMASTVNALTFKNNNDTGDDISVKVYYPKSGTSNTEQESCFNADDGDAVIVFDINTLQHGKEISTGISGDRPPQRICLLAGKFKGTQQWTATNPIWDVVDCKITFHRVQNKHKAWVTATPECGFTCITTDNGQCNE